MLHQLGVSLCLLSAATAVSAQLYWNSTQYLFTFGDSYTTDGFNISAGVNSTDPGYVSVRQTGHQTYAFPSRRLMYEPKDLV